jgi:hypothetical protein
MGGPHFTASCCVAYGSSYPGGRDQEGHDPRLALDKKMPIWKITKAKKGRACGSSGRAPAYQVQDIHFKSQYHQKNPKKPKKSTSNLLQLISEYIGFPARQVHIQSLVALVHLLRN